MAILYFMDVKITSAIERIIAILAPYWCVQCGLENNVLCQACADDVFGHIESCCVVCAKPTVDWRLCVECGRTTNLGSVWVAAQYNEVPARLIKMFKFQRARATVEPLVLALDDAVPYVDVSTIIVPLPTAPQRARQRGYDQAVLLARVFAKKRGLEFASPLSRLHSLRQVGASREVRIAQARAAYAINPGVNLKGRSILLIDDICTTGASLSAAARLLRKAGATEVNAAVVAWQKPKV